MPNEADFNELERRVAELMQRIYRLEQQLAAGGRAPSAAPSAPPPAPLNTAVPPSVDSPKSPPPPSPKPPTSLPASMQQTLKQPMPSAQKRDLESRIGSQWLNRIGIVAMLTGAAYFLKLAFDYNWIGPSGRVAIGLIAGIGLVAWSSKFHHKGYKYFSYSLTATGIGIMYLSLWAAFQVYQLLPAPVAFVAMVLVTASAGVMALRQDAQVLAAVAIAGGFSTPALLSTGQNRPFTLFFYIAVLNVFGIVLAALKPWRRLLLACFIGTIIFYTGWFSEFEDPGQSGIAAGFATLFFLQFAILPVLKRLHSFGDKTWHGSRTILVVTLANPAVYFVELYVTYDFTDHTHLSWVAVALGAFYIFLSKRLTDGFPPPKDSESIGPVHAWLHLAIAITFLTIAIPLKLHSHWITMGWFVESAILLWIGDRAKITFLQRAAIIALALGVARMLCFDQFNTTTLIFNARFATYAMAITVLVGIALQISKEKGQDHQALLVVSICVNVLALIALNAEIGDYFNRSYRDLGPTGSGYHDWKVTRDFAYSALWMVYGAALMAVGFWRKSQALRWQALVLIALTIAKVFLYDLSSLSGPLRVLSFIALGALLMGISFVYQKDWLKLSGKEP